MAEMLARETRGPRNQSMFRAAGGASSEPDPGAWVCAGIPTVTAARLSYYSVSERGLGQPLSARSLGGSETRPRR